MKYLWVILITVLVIGAGLLVYLAFSQPEPETAEQVETQQELSYKVVDTNQSKCFDNEKEITCPKEGAKFYGQDVQTTRLKSSYKDNGDGTVADLNTNLMWQKNPGNKITYSQAKEKIKSFILAGHDDWRTPTIKELYSLIDFNGINPSENSQESDSTPFINERYFDFKYGGEQEGDRIIDSQWVTSTVYKSNTKNEQCFFGVKFAYRRIKS